MSLVVNISKNIGGFRLNLKFEVQKEIFVLFGPSGAGKTLCLKSISGLDSQISQKISLDLKSLEDLERKEWVSPSQRKIGYVFQDLALFPHMNVEQNISYGISKDLKGELRNQKVCEFLQRFELTKISKSSVCDISGGEKQRVAIARALIGEPKALLLDEPFSSLDQRLKQEMHELILEIHREWQIPIVLVTHDFDEAKNLASTISMIENGSIYKTMRKNYLGEWEST